MSLLDGLSSLLGSGGTAGATDPASLIKHVSDMVQSQGGLQAVVDKFHSAGLSQEVSSWVGTGSNLPISAQQIQAVLGSAPVAALAAKLGIPADQAASHLASLLPGLIDHASPNGQVPTGSPDLMTLGLNLLKGKLLG